MACGTVSTNCLPALQRENDIPVIGVVEPAVRAAAERSVNRRVGLVATRASVSSGAFEEAFGRLAPGAALFQRPCPLFVPLVEEGRCKRGDRVIEMVAEEYLAPLRAEGVDTLVLGCTHYPLLAEVIGQVMGPEVALVDAGAEAARACRELLAAENALAEAGDGSAVYCTSDRAEDFQRLASLFLGEDITGQARQIDISQY